MAARYRPLSDVPFVFMVACAPLIPAAAGLGTFGMFAGSALAFSVSEKSNLLLSLACVAAALVALTFLAIIGFAGLIGSVFLTPPAVLTVIIWRGITAVMPEKRAG